MPINADSKLRVVINSSLLAQQVENVLHYGITSTAAISYAGFAQAFWDDIKATWRAATTITTTALSIDVYDNTDPLGEFGSYAIPTAEQPGLNGADSGAPELAAGFLFSVPSRLTKPGSMRLAGVRGSDVGAGGFFIPATMVKYNALAANLLDGFNFGLLAAGHANLLVYGAPHPASVRFPARDTPVYQAVSAVSVRPYSTTQNTRKYGRGA